MLGGGLVGGVLGVVVLVHGDEVIDAAARGAHAGRAPVEPHLRVVGTDRVAIRLHGVHGAAPERLEDGEHPLELVGLQVAGDRGAGHLLRRGPQERGHARVHVDHIHVGAHARDAERRVADDLVEERVAASELRLRAMALVEQVQRIAMRQHLVGHEKDADAAGQDAGELVEALAAQGLPEHSERGGEHGGPRQYELPQSDRPLDGLHGSRLHGPQRGEGDQEVAGEPARVEDASELAVRVVRGHVCERAVRQRGAREASEQDEHAADVGAARASERDDQHCRSDDVADRVGEGDHLGFQRLVRCGVQVAQEQQPGDEEQ